jgi:general stress protein YciG
LTNSGKGGFATNPELAREAGRKGGEAMKRIAEGTTMFSDRGKVGGEKVKAAYGLDHYKRLGAEGGRKRGELARAKKEAQLLKEKGAGDGTTQD